MNAYIILSYADLVAASVFIVINGLFSLALRLGLERSIFVACVRMIVQLSLIGLLLKTVFAIASPWLTLIVASCMAAIAGREIWARQERRLAGIWGYGIGASSMTIACTLVTVIALTTQIGPSPWWLPRYALPLFGMILGNTMTGISLGLDTFHTALYRERNAIEAQLLLGYSRWHAVRPATRHAIRSGFMPIINAMAAAGVVALPGMMTGQILSGIDPQDAVKYQLLVMFLISGATGLGVIGAIFSSMWRLTDDRHRLRLDRLISKK